MSTGKVIHVDFEKLEKESWARLEAASKTYHSLREWTPEQVEKLKRFYGKVSLTLLAEECHHSEIACKAKATDLKLGVEGWGLKDGVSRNK